MNKELKCKFCCYLQPYPWSFEIVEYSEKSEMSYRFRILFWTGKFVAMETYDMIMKKFYQKYLLLVFYYPPEWVLRQYILTCQISYFLVIFECFLCIKSHLGRFSQITAQV